MDVWGENGQSALQQSHAVLVGCGALGGLQAEALVRAGVGKLTVIDRDFVEIGNLHRQFLFSEQDAEEGVPKAAAAVKHLAALNSAAELQAEVADLEPRNIRELCAGANVILDATDNFETRFLINDYSVESGTPWIHGAAVGTYGLTFTVLPGETPCYRCLYPEPPAGAQPTCETTGVLSAVTMTIATVQSTEALKLLSGNRAALRGTVLTADVWANRLRESPLPERDPECPACALRSFPWLEGQFRVPVSLCGASAVQIHAERAMSLSAVAKALEPLGTVRRNEFALWFECEPYRLTVFPDGRVIVKGTTDTGVARSVYARYFGQ